MCKRVLMFAFISLVFFSANGQYTIKGKVVSIKNEPLEGVSIAVKDSYDGTTSDKDGFYSFSISDTGQIILLFTNTGFKTAEKDVVINEKLTIIDVQLKEAITDLKAVVITAGTFEAGDKKRTTVLKSVDVVTTAGQQADVVAALKTLPGTQQVGEQEGLFVRGGTGAETKVFIDGMMVNNPFYSSVPGIAQRSRYSPLLFKGTIFSSGGYSAQYGQALSSVLALESIDLPSRSEVNTIISSAQLSFLGQHLNKAKTSSTGININYNNLTPYFAVVSQKYPYDKAPEAINAEFNFRRKVKGGFIKLYSYNSYNEVGFNRPSLDFNGYNEYFYIKNKNAFANATYTGRLGKNWNLYAGSAFSYNQDDIKTSTGNTDTSVFYFAPQLTNVTIQSKAVFTKNFAGLTKLYIGAEYQNINDKISAKDSIEHRAVHDNYISGFVESDIYFSVNLVSRVGVRYEYSGLLNRSALAPRLSLAYKLKEGSQFSFSYGSFYQKPETNYLLRNTSLQLSKADHYILNFQKVKNGQTLRLEVFQKTYNNLITTNPTNSFDITNEGKGHARGLELFWRDKTNIKNLDYWISYSFLDTKRKYLDYPFAVQPSFAAKHTLSIVAKRWVNVLSTQFSATYSYASGRPFYNPNKGSKDFMSQFTMDYHSLGLQANYLRTFGKVNAVFIVNIGNALGNKQVFGYRYASKINAEGEYSSEAVTPMAKRFIFLGAYLSIGSDRRKDILD